MKCIIYEKTHIKRAQNYRNYIAYQKLSHKKKRRDIY